MTTATSAVMDGAAAAWTPRWVTSGAPRRVEDLEQWLDAQILADLGWDPVRSVLVFPAEHPLVGWTRCQSDGCLKQARRAGYCGGCRPNDAADAGKPPRRTTVGIGSCAVTSCRRPWHNEPARLCSGHLAQQKTLRLPLEEFVAHPAVAPYAGVGNCQADGCPRDRDQRQSRYCAAHRRQWHKARRAEPGLDETLWRRTVAPISENNAVSLRGLAEPLRLEILYGIQQRVRADFKTQATVLRSMVNLARQQRAGTLERIEVPKTVKQVSSLRNSLLQFVQRSGLSTETEIGKDTWTGAVFGIGGYLHFEHISQPWLRAAMKRWVIDDLPRHRGGQVHSIMQARIREVERLSESLRLQRPDRGLVVTVLGHADIVVLLNRLAHQADTGAISPKVRYDTCGLLRFILSGMRGLALTRPGGPLHGLPDDFTVRHDEIPRYSAVEEAGRDLPTGVMRQLCATLPTLDDLAVSEVRTAIELIIDTGRRPQEVTTLAWDCLERDHDGHPVLVYDNIKSNRPGRRLPVAEATAELINRQKHAVRQRFPHAPISTLKLLPTTVANPSGSKAISHSYVSTVHHRWVQAIPTLVDDDGNDIDRNTVVLYAYRHTYAQRHADAGVPVDVLRELMNHRQLHTTQGYYRVGEQRRRDAVDRVAQLQFDRHGTRIWRTAKTLLDTEHVRRAVGEVAVPYGTCTEPSNVAAAGQDCPVRFRCVGCGHFRTDVSYLPDLQAHLADLLRSRERLIAATDIDDWARVQATPADAEIDRVRHLIDRISGDLNDLDPDDRRQIEDAVTTLRRSRATTVALGLPSYRQTLAQQRPERTA